MNHNGNRILWGIIGTFGAVLVALGAFVLTSVQSHAERITRVEEAVIHVEKYMERQEAMLLDQSHKIDLLVQARWRDER